MNNRVIGVKKSQFTGSTSIPADAYFDFVSNSRNVRIPFADFLNSLGVSGSISQTGNVLAVPVLDKHGPVNAIRNLEAGEGIQIEVRPDNGIRISQDFGRELLFDTVADALANPSLKPGDKVSWLGYYEPGDGGANDGAVEVPFGTADGGSVFDTANGNQVRALFVDKIIRDKQFGVVGDGVADDSARYQALADYTPQSCDVSFVAETPLLLSDVSFLEKGRPNDGAFKISASGPIFKGTASIIFDSCKNLHLEGLQYPTGTLDLRGVWFSEFEQCKFSTLILSTTAGTVYTSVYWIKFLGGMFQEILKGGTDPANAISFYGTAFRGDASQGFTSSKAYMIQATGGPIANLQNWNFYGGDISYYTAEVLNITTAADIEISFDGIYFDSLAPKVEDFAGNQYIRTENCHVAGKFVGGASHLGALRGQGEYHGDVHSVGWKPYQLGNVVPNGDLAQHLTSYTNSFGGPIGAFINGTVTPVDDPSEGLYLNLSVGNGDATFTSCSFRAPSTAVKWTGKYSSVLIIRNADPGVRSLNFGFGSQFFDIDVREEWTLVPFSSQLERSAGTTLDLLMRSEDGLGYNVDVRYVAICPGTAPPIQIPQASNLISQDEVRATKIVIGDITVTARPIDISGTGSPEGVVTAVRGSTFRRRDGAAGTCFYVKESGVGNTGWVAK